MKVIKMKSPIMRDIEAQDTDFIFSLCDRILNRDTTVRRMDFIFLALCIVLIFAIFLHQQYTVRQKFKNFPQIDAYPIVGVAIKLARLSHYERLKYFVSLMERCKEEIFVQWLVNKPMINVYKPEHLEQVFPSTVNITKGEEYDLLRPWLGNGLLTSTGKDAKSLHVYQTCLVCTYG
ncbi:cytochrome P450 4c21-like [Temnothorax curvispinosus]|uniref:Cytochrome P450 4c21-like n=1 Tax=Temnothorax curvispinosus TaxID=300111 RepID=A0A6J1PGI3_9HYME|nr:cytochrome P450 4c21-like [Temnothorax curvispinosus]